MTEATGQKTVLFVCSSGGHLDQLLTLLPAPEGVEIVFATFNKPDAVQKIEGYRFFPIHWPTNRSVKNLIRNSGVALKVLRSVRPDVIVSSGAAGAVPFFYFGRVFYRARTVFIECIDRVTLPTLTAKLVKPVTSTYVVQWPEQLQDFPRRFELSASR